MFGKRRVFGRSTERSRYVRLVGRHDRERQKAFEKTEEVQTVSTVIPSDRWNYTVLYSTVQVSNADRFLNL